MDDIVTVTEFCERFRIPSSLREFYGWNTDVIRLDKANFNEKEADILACEKKRPASSLLPSYSKKPAVKEHRIPYWNLPPKFSVPASRASIISAQTEISRGSILETDDAVPPVSQCSILQSETLQTSILDSEIHMTTQSSPPPVILSSSHD
ncbi:uncharacterized protein KLLA0_E15533g [Kluyveromyces lactis]|uniref:KLLA0E15533p n=1 Tax=Kluyveromyces lactis (strain ATCC 8585 / CBS 2359 / DSM 70799 / NBRC 1267 / NRRL Y-1140 / WM37) TaxID=284590 RepID=Q6CN38_KLULA|nr:uncharacterized protein KLLA0_E15533g [Kluyveromyces lactis]CAG99738.1 KLLA0E15533p [Kluyveromyces lactis]|eukprot:XP_454651.1 uncharacterized protein KLLA0_E15533g [Kluyveromyces lactis]